MDSFHVMEESLKAFLIEAQSDNYNRRNTNFYRYNNLRILMEPNKNKTPHIIIRIGISESMYDTKEGDHISGSLGSDERYIKRWLLRHMSRFDFNKSWEEAKLMKEEVKLDAQVNLNGDSSPGKK